ncbi:hypothetical protein V1478_010984 [Vespula squamosa]|uniref:Uncharacterized protein n=1 Tax=Vespula squamosa TaxID=30214 RepID=A0ABD2AFW7_VESSQ
MLSRHRRVPIPGFPQRGPIIQLGERNEWPAFTYEDAEYLITSEAERGLVEWVKTVGEVGGCRSTIPCIWFRPLNEQCFRRGGREGNTMDDVPLKTRLTSVNKMDTSGRHCCP